MRILFVSDYNINQNIGGAQRSNQLIIDYGRKIGHQIVEFNNRSNIDILNRNYDALISSNLHAISQTEPEILNYICAHHNHYRLEHDMNYYLSDKQRYRLFNSVQNSIFLTDYHYNQFIERYGDIFPRSVIIPDPIDGSMFYDFDQQRSDIILYVGFMHYLKGTQNFFKYVISNMDKQFAMYAWDSFEGQFLSQAYSFPNITVYNPVQYTDMPKIYNTYSTMFYQPEFHEPFCRSVGEAIMCGMNIIGNDKIGCLHLYNQVGKDKFSDLCTNAPQQFWEIIK